MNSSTRQSYPNPQDTTNVVSNFFYWWTTDIFKKGYTNFLFLKDLYDPLEIDRATFLGDKLEKQWNSQLNTAQIIMKTPNISKTIFLTFRTEFLLAALYHILELFFSLVIPLLLGLLLKCFIPQSTSTVTEAVMYAAALMFTDLLKILLTNHKLFDLVHLGGRIRIAVSSLIYRKALRLSKTALGETTPGKIVNLVANDVNRLDFAIFQSNYVWSTPLSTIIIGYILYIKGGYAALVGMATLLIIVPIQEFTANLSIKYRRRAVLKTDKRVQLLEEIVSGVQMIKMYAWEMPFCALMEKARKLELKIIRKSACLRDICLAFNLFTPRIAFYFTLVAMLECGQHLSVQKVFVLLPFYYLLADTVTLSLRGLVSLVECSVSIRRIQSFLILDEFSPKPLSGTVNFFKTMHDESSESNGINHLSQEIWTVNLDNIIAKWKLNSFNNALENINIKAENLIETCAVNLENLSAKWKLNSSDNTLENINLKLEKGKLYAVIGIVGSGKSSLFSSMLREIKVIDGYVRVKGNLSYAAQDTWVFGNTVRQNILFGECFDQQRYQLTVEACCLLPDFKQLPDGDLTVVGEKGVCLSGGQKARINLARAVYRKADVYLLDDPLSAIDASVGKRLFHKCILGFLKNKTRLLATHQLQYIRYVDGIILMSEGRAQYYTSYHHLLCDYPEYRSLIAITEKEDSITKADVNSQLSGGDDVSTIKQINNNSRKLEDIMEESYKHTAKSSLLLKYYKAGSNFYLIFIMCLLFVITQSCVCLNDLFVLTITIAEESRYQYYNVTNNSNFNTRMYMERQDVYPTKIYIYIYTTLVLSIFFIGIIRALVYCTLCLRSSRSLHNSIFEALIKTNLRFFTRNPSGRILTRYSQDVSILDELLPRSVIESAQMLLLAFGAMVLACTVNPIFFIPTVIIIILCYWISNIFVKTSNNIKRLEGITRAPVLTHLNETLNGVSTIRVCQAEKILIEEFEKFQDSHTSAWYNIISCRFAYDLSIKLLIHVLLVFVAYGSAIFKDHFGDGHIGLGITQLLSVSSLLTFGSIISAEVMHQLMAVERLLEYSQLPKESENENIVAVKRIRKNLSMSKCTRMSQKWPKRGCIEFKNVSMRYSDDEEPVLKKLSFVINSTEKVGIVGRTGAGKSSLIAALFRLEKLKGSIAIDGIDTGSLPLQILRSRISIIPQDPVLFSGTLRCNLDPFNEFSDDYLWDSLEQVKLKNVIATSENGLDCPVIDKGSNFSIGQRQLICLARAVLRKNRLLVSDEATANVDPYTDSLIQRTIRTKFSSCTVLTVANRLNTIMDSDRVIVMHNGYLVEFDHPYNLLLNEFSRFTALVKETGKTMSQQLFDIAKQSYEEKHVYL